MKRDRRQEGGRCTAGPLTCLDRHGFASWRFSQSIELPAIVKPSRLRGSRVRVSRRRELVPQLFTKSQLVVLLLQLGGLQKTADLGAPLVLSLLGVALLLLLLDEIELRVVAGELPQGNQEVTER